MLSRSDRQIAWLGIAAAIAAIVAASLVTPVPGDPDHLTLFGMPFGSVCAFRAASGLPCPSCGMTRSWVWAARGELGTALRFNAAGVLFLAGILGNGLLRVWLLAGRTVPRRAWMFVVGGGVGFVAVWLGGWALRLAGYYPLA